MEPASTSTAPPPVILVMGVSGCGKSTLGSAIAEAIDGAFIDADDFHPPANIEKMRAGLALDDDDRANWLDALNETLREGLRHGKKPQVLACSALKQAYRQRLNVDVPVFHTVFLDGPRSVLETRLKERTGHFMPLSLLDSQLAALEPPTAPGVLRIPLEMPLEEAVRNVRQLLEE